MSDLDEILEARMNHAEGERDFLLCEGDPPRELAQAFDACEPEGQTRRRINA